MTNLLISDPLVGMVSFWLRTHNNNVERVISMVKESSLFPDKEILKKMLTDLRGKVGREKDRNVGAKELVKLVLDVTKTGKFNFVVETTKLGEIEKAFLEERGLMIYEQDHKTKDDKDSRSHSSSSMKGKNSTEDTVKSSDCTGSTNKDKKGTNNVIMDANEIKKDSVGVVQERCFSILPPPREAKIAQEQIIQKLKEKLKEGSVQMKENVSDSVGAVQEKLKEGSVQMKDNVDYPIIATAIISSRATSDINRDLQAVKLTNSHYGRVILLRIVPLKDTSDVHKEENESFRKDLTFLVDILDGTLLMCDHNSLEMEKLVACVKLE